MVTYFTSNVLNKGDTVVNYVGNYFEDFYLKLHDDL